MNKTVNINLGGTFFHIDEDAFQKLSRYFEAIKNYLSDSDGKEEIIRDIEIRIAELLSDKLKSDKQVISTQNIDEVIAIMGEPEAYRLDDEEPTSKTHQNTHQKNSKKLYRDTENGIIGGVLAGLAHYFGIDKAWLRIILVFLLIFYGTGVFVYIILWIVMPEAKTTSEKLEMKGEKVNISNIEKKVREEFNNISQKVSDIDYEKFGDKVKTGAESFGNSLGNFFTSLFRIIGKIIGVFIIMFSIGALVSLLIALVTLGSTEFFQLPFLGISEAFNYSEVPVWALVLLFLMAIGIPFIALMILGFRILITNSKPLNSIFKYSLLGIWIISIIGLTVIGVRQATEIAFEEKVAINQTVDLQSNDTLQISLVSNPKYDAYNYSEFRLVLDQNDKETIYSNQVSFTIKKTNQSAPYLTINKLAGGNSLINAKKRADEIRYNFQVTENKIVLDDYLLADLKSKFRNQKVQIEIFIPENKVFYIDQSSDSNHTNIYLKTNLVYDNLSPNNYYIFDKENYTCLNCVEKTQESNDSIIISVDQKTRLIVDENGVIIKNN